MKGLFFIIIALYTAGNIYIFIRALQTITSQPVGVKIIFSTIFWIAAFSLFISIFARDLPLPQGVFRGMHTIGSIWMVFTLYMVLALIATDILKLLLPNFGGRFFYAFAFTCSLLIYGYWNYKNPKTVELNLKMEKPHPAMKIVAVSDIHLGHGTGKKQLQKYVERINALNPDIVLIGGDLIDNSIAPLYMERMDEELSQLKAPLGVYMAPGNHEYISGIGKCREFLEKTPITLLRDSLITLPNGVQLIGRDDHSNRKRKPLSQLVGEAIHTQPIIVVDHQPYNLAESDACGVDLQFSGHTHRGQVWPMSLLTDKMFEQSYGYRRWRNTHVYVSSGLSLWGPPFRIGTNSEIVVINIT